MTTVREDELLAILVAATKELIIDCGYEVSHIISVCEQVANEVE